MTSFWLEFQIRAGQLPGMSGKNDQAERVFSAGLAIQCPGSARPLRALSLLVLETGSRVRPAFVHSLRAARTVSDFIAENPFIGTLKGGLGLGC